MILRYEFILYFSCHVKTTILTTLLPTSFMKYFFMPTLLYKKKIYKNMIKIIKK
jgi:hypothetical protein